MWNNIRGVAFTPDGKTAAMASEQSLYIMDVAKEAHVMPQELNLTQVKRSLRNVKTRIRAGLMLLRKAFAVTGGSG